MLHRAADAEREVQVGVDDDAGGADLALVADPAAVGDDAGRAHRRAERGGDRGELRRSGRRRRARRRRRRSGRPRRGPSSSRRRQHLDDSGVVPVAGVDRDRGDRRRRSVRSASTPRTPGCSVTTTGSRMATVCRSRPPARARRARSAVTSTAPASSGGRARGRGGARGRGRRARPGSTTTSSSTSGARAARPAGGGERAELDEAQVGGDAGQLVGVGSDPARIPRPPHSAIASAAPAGSTPSRTGTTASIRSG